MGKRLEGKVAFLEADPDVVRRQEHTYPLGRPGTMRECAYAALFLSSDESSFVTGHALMVDGGLTAQLQDAAAEFVEERVLAELGMSGGAWTRAARGHRRRHLPLGSGRWSAGMVGRTYQEMSP